MQNKIGIYTATTSYFALTTVPNSILFVQKLKHKMFQCLKIMALKLNYFLINIKSMNQTHTKATIFVQH